MRLGRSLALSPVMGTSRKGRLGYDDIVSSVRRQTLPNKNLEVFVKSVCVRPNESSAFFFFPGLEQEITEGTESGVRPTVGQGETLPVISLLSRLAQLKSVGGLCLRPSPPRLSNRFH